MLCSSVWHPHVLPHPIRCTRQTYATQLCCAQVNRTLLTWNCAQVNRTLLTWNSAGKPYFTDIELCSGKPYYTHMEFPTQEVRGWGLKGITGQGL